jgi:hypothetical protein
MHTLLFLFRIEIIDKDYKKVKPLDHQSNELKGGDIG